VIELAVNNKVFEGWKSFSITFDMESLVTEFTLTLFDKDNQFSALIEEGLECQLYARYDNASPRILLTTGYIVDITEKGTVDGTSMTISGKGKTIDLVECSSFGKKFSWYGKRRLSDIVNDIVTPFGITLYRFNLGTDPEVENFRIQSNETAFGTIERLCRIAAVLPQEVNDGGLSLTYAGLLEAAKALEDGVNIEEWTRSRSWQDRFSKYIGLAQNAGNGKKWTKANTQAKAEAVDPEITRHRPRVFIAETKADNKNLSKRVDWEKQTRKARGQVFNIKVKGIFQNPSRVWAKNELVSLTIARKNIISLQMLVTKVTMSKTLAGTFTSLTLKDKDLFKQL
jgi:prophage tail gpP-like protein